MTACLIVRAQVADAAVRKDFDRWYQEEHLPDALKAFRARRAWRGWSDVDSSVHYAYYEFDDLASARALQGSEGLKRMVAEFDRMWDGKATRIRDYIEIVQALGA